MVNSHQRIDPLAYVHVAGKRSRRLLQDRDTLAAQLQLMVSVLAAVAVLAGLAIWRDGTLQSHYRYLTVIIAISQLTIYNWRGICRRFNGFLGGCLRIGRSWLLLVGVVVVAIFFSQTGEQFSRAVILGWSVLGYASQIAIYQLAYMANRRARQHAIPMRKALVVGMGPLAKELVASVNRNNWISDRVVGMIGEADAEGDSDSSLGVPLLGDIDVLAKVVVEREISRVYIVVPIGRSQEIERIYDALSSTTVDVVWVPDIFSMQLLNHSVKELNGLPLITLSESPLASETKALFKSIFDKVIASLMLVALSPLMMAIAFLVWQSSPGPIIFRQSRHGWDGRVIEVWKFRSMKVHVDRRVSQAKRNDNRVTRIGRFIRRTSIDELPQLFNVLQGRMSLVGPRPHAIEHNDFYSRQIPSYMLRHRIKPGITGLAQVSGYRGETDTLDKMLRRVELDIQYINNWSLWLDLVILLKTPRSLFSKDVY